MIESMNPAAGTPANQPAAENAASLRKAPADADDTTTQLSELQVAGQETSASTRAKLLWIEIARMNQALKAMDREQHIDAVNDQAEQMRKQADKEFEAQSAQAGAKIGAGVLTLASGAMSAYGSIKASGKGMTAADGTLNAKGQRTSESWKFGAATANALGQFLDGGLGLVSAAASADAKRLEASQKLEQLRADLAKDMQGTASAQFQQLVDLIKQVGDMLDKERSASVRA